MKRARKYSRETRERAVGLVWETEGQRGSQWAAIQSVSEKIGCTPETLMVAFVDDHTRVRGRADLQDTADRSVDLLRLQGSRGRPDEGIGPGAARRIPEG